MSTSAFAVFSNLMVAVQLIKCLTNAPNVKTTVQIILIMGSHILFHNNFVLLFMLLLVPGNSLLVLAISVLLLLSNITCLYVRWVHIHRYYYFVLLCFTNFDNCFCWFFNCHCFFIIQGIHLYIRFKFQIILPRLILMSYQLQNVMFEPRFSSNSIRLFFFNLFFMFYSFFHHSASSYFYHSYMPDT